MKIPPNKLGDNQLSESNCGHESSVGALIPCVGSMYNMSQCSYQECGAGVQQAQKVELMLKKLEKENIRDPPCCFSGLCLGSLIATAEGVMLV